ncbi:MAG: cation:proton antiporter [Waddliaceae bacterium]
MDSDPIIPIFVSTIFLILVIGVILRKLRQSHVVAYLLTGFLLGPHMLGIIEDQQALTRIGSFGVVFLLFFIGMEISPRRLTENWLISIVGTFLQIGVSVFLVSLLGIYLEWPAKRMVLLGFVMSLSSTAVVLKLLEDWKEINTRVGQNVLGILLVQDILIVPMLICLSFLGGRQLTTRELVLQGVGGVVMIFLVAWITIKDQIHLSWATHLKNDHELQVFASLGICFGMAMLSGFMGLSAALGAFVGGMIVGSARETQWMQQRLLSIRTIFIALFFVSIGMLIDIDFIAENIWQILFLVGIVLLTNTFINTAILKFLGEAWDISLYGGSLLSQIGEFSFVIASVGYQSYFIMYPAYEMTIAVIALTLFFSPMWILFIRRLAKITEKRLRQAP